MIERTLSVDNRLGLHARAAAQLVHTASRFDCRVLVVNGDEEVNAKSILGLLALSLEPGRWVTVRCDGNEEGAAMEALEALFASGFGEGCADSGAAETGRGREVP